MIVLKCQACSALLLSSRPNPGQTKLAHRSAWLEVIDSYFFQCAACKQPHIGSSRNSRVHVLRVTEEGFERLQLEAVERNKTLSSELREIIVERIKNHKLGSAYRLEPSMLALV